MSNQPTGATTQDVPLSAKLRTHIHPILLTLFLAATSTQAQAAIADNKSTPVPAAKQQATTSEKTTATATSDKAPPGQAEPLSATELAQLRQRYRKALGALNRKDLKTARSLLPRLRSYPLHGYLDYRLTRANLSSLTAQRYDQFSRQHAATPLPNRLRNQWLPYLIKKKQWQTFLRYYPTGTSRTRLQCQRLLALHKTGNSKQAFDDTEALWTVGHSQPSACNKPFESWIKAGKLTEEIAFKRFWLALDKGEISLARYITRYIKDKELKKHTQNALNLQKKPANLATVRLSPQQPGYTALVTTALKHLARIDTEQAVKLWLRFKPTLKLDPQESSRLEQRLGLRLLQNFDRRSPHWLKQLDPKYKNTTLLEWRLRYQLSQQNWTQVEQLLDQLPAPEQSKDKWSYWRGRSLEQNGGKPEAIEIFERISSNRSFYGFLAADRLGLEYSLNNRSVPADPAAMRSISSRPAMLTIRELFFHDQLSDARREWWRLSRNFSSTEHYNAALLARRWGWYSQAIFSAIKARMWDDLRLRFPAPYSQKISASSEKHSLDNSWIFAVARQESAFNASVRSPAGATGLMQLMPATAKQTAKTIQLKYRGREQLKDPDFNISLGSAYLSQMLNLHKGNRVWATAAYNAGPHRVKRWLKERGSLPVDLWIETIPFSETRQYVQNVLSYAVIYSDLLGQQKRFLTESEASTLPRLN